MRAAVLYEVKAPLKVEELEVTDLHPEEVLVKTAASGVCHSDLHIIKGDNPYPLPVVLGHEAAGIVEKVGSGVRDINPGDHCVISFMPQCGQCPYCTIGRPNLCIVAARSGFSGVMPDGTSRLRKGAQEIKQFMDVASFGEYMVVQQNSVITIRKDAPLDKVCLVGCGVMTGVGAAINTARVRAGSSCVVIACGGVGLNVVQGCALAGAAKIIAVDTNPRKLDLAEQFGATHVINSSQEDPARQVRRLTQGGADYAFEAIGLPVTIEQAFRCIRRGGQAVVVGQAAAGATVTIDALEFLAEKTLTGSLYGSARPRVDMPALVDLYMDGRLKLDELVSRTIDLGEVNNAFDLMEKGEVARSVIVY